LGATRSYTDGLNSIHGFFFDPGHSYRIRKLRSGSPGVRPVKTTNPDTFAFGTGEPLMVGPRTEPTGLVFRNMSFLTVYEKWSKSANALLAYSYHYQIPGGPSIRYDMDERDLPDHPKHHLQSSQIGEHVRLPTGEITCVQVLEMIYASFL
jgi:hypothetical protein